jgi:hypothetical protein
VIIAWAQNEQVEINNPTCTNDNQRGDVWEKKNMSDINPSGKI